MDAAGGSGSDSFAVAISFRTKEGIGVLACLREFRPPFDPNATVEEVARLLKSYRVHQIHGDRYSGDWVADRFRAHGVAYTFAEKTKSGFYSEFLPLLNSRRVELLDHKRLLSQLCSLERRATRGSGREVIDHPAGSGAGGQFHDDLINAAAISLVMAQAKPPIKIHDSVMQRVRAQSGERALAQAQRGGWGTALKPACFF